ncbi:hypothetical protein JX265_010518 [Neoarthrinium moseri]|uniref:Uncharacterized protein n=1 Tax=Neoarthrinium moseri TaxID=1658444 RepID=A0A9P9WE49_9PEZI|nr:hypothetical protein JX265_010518 [Neoarthrinium moseri]
MSTDAQPPIVDETTAQPATVTSGGGDILMDSYVDFINNDHGTAPDQWLVPTHEGLFTEHPSTPVDEEIVKSYQKMESFCDQMEPWYLYDPKSSLYYITNRVKEFTAEMARTSATPFLHRCLYKDYTPQCMLSCFTTSVLYANRTPANKPMVMRAIHGVVRELINVEAGRNFAAPIEKLARTQTLFMYQTIRLFDGNITMRAQGEKDMPLLQTWLSELCNMRDNLGELAQLESSATRTQPPREWEQWVFAESVRRTIVIAYSVITLYETMKEPEEEDDPGPWAYIHRWTLARALWEAGSPSEFDRMWKSSSHYIISNYSFEKFLEHGKGKDVDEFAEILLCVFIGVDATKEFISTHQD